MNNSVQLYYIPQFPPHVPTSFIGMLPTRCTQLKILHPSYHFNHDKAGGGSIVKPVRAPESPCALVHIPRLPVLFCALQLAPHSHLHEKDTSRERERDKEREREGEEEREGEREKRDREKRPRRERIRSQGESNSKESTERERETSPFVPVPPFATVSLLYRYNSPPVLPHLPNEGP